MSFVMVLAIVMFLITCTLNGLEFFNGKKFQILEFCEFMNIICFSLFTKSVYASDKVDPKLAEFASTTLFKIILMAYLIISIAFIAIRMIKKRK